MRTAAFGRDVPMLAAASSALASARERSRVMGGGCRCGAVIGAVTSGGREVGRHEGKQGEVRARWQVRTQAVARSRLGRAGCSRQRTCVGHTCVSRSRMRRAWQRGHERERARRGVVQHRGEVQRRGGRTAGARTRREEGRGGRGRRNRRGGSPHSCREGAVGSRRLGVVRRRRGEDEVTASGDG